MPVLGHIYELVDSRDLPAEARARAAGGWARTWLAGRSRRTSWMPAASR